MKCYKAIALQVKCESVNHLRSKEDVEAQLLKKLDSISEIISASIAFIGKEVKLVVVPEYYLTGFPLKESVDEWRDKACFDENSSVFERICKIAFDNEIYFSGNSYMTDRHFPDLYFQCSYIISPQGKLILKYRRLNSMFSPSPHDVWEKFIDVYSIDTVFPTADTEIGVLACVASEEILFPEISRILMIKGAEVFCHSSSEIYGGKNLVKDVAKFARAFENNAYVISANSGGLTGIAIPENSTDGGSKIIDYRGLLLAESGQGETINSFADIDITALRRYRKRPGMSNMIARQRLDIYAKIYKEASFYPPNTLLTEKPTKQLFLETQQDVINKLLSNKIIRD